MAGKRLLDAARLASASSAVAKQHFALRRQQWDVYTRTSSLAKAVKDQTDRVTVTAAAGLELASRLRDTGPTWQEGRHAEASGRGGERTVDRREGEVGDGVVGVPLQGLDPQRQTGSAAEKSERVRPHPPDTQATPEASSGQDTFNTRPTQSAPSVSALPHTDLPEHATTAPDSPGSGDLNQDTFPSPQDAPPEGVNTDIFSSPKVSQMLRQTSGTRPGNPYANRKKMPPKPLPEMLAAREKWEAEKREQTESTPAMPSTTVEPDTVAASTQIHDQDTNDLAAEIAQYTAPSPEPTPTEPTALDTPPAKAYELRESRVPSSRFGRLWQYGGLATSMAFGAVGESLRRVAGGGAEGSLMLSEANMNRLVAKLSRMRGAALKLGQMISFQDSKVLPATINAVLQRVQDSADYMPASQRDKVLTTNLGPAWRDLFSAFTEKPFAAASIGQVHRATLASNGKDVAVKIQYPGVRDSISSDLNNLSLLLTASRLLPPGLFLDRTIANARTELGWECDYEREAAACTRFRALLHDSPDFAVPEIYPEASGPGVLTAEFMHGVGVTKTLGTLTQAERDWIGSSVLRLCLRELMEWRFMQTDPNWTNFLYNKSSGKLELLDFGASREFPDAFIEPYVALLIAASHGDRETCRARSIDLGYLTGAESAAMTTAHVDSILVLAEPFAETAGEVYDFSNQTITERVRAKIGVMVRERMVPPPEETYSLHRKLSGAFLLCARLGSRVRAREMFAQAVRVWNQRAKGGSSGGS
ncbi:hypothetical protein LTR53_016631 [Teratosphaeriaceae sp. CCFEE 6253]|nr:hypothetical protein LTR53_016631 [Teratosphaeriaceae sp. CCFEE 6253]